MIKPGKLVVDQSGFASFGAAIILVVIGVSGLVGWRTLGKSTKGSTESKPLISPAPQPTVTPPTTNTAPQESPKPTTAIEAFYDNLQIGMSSNQVIELAGRQPNDCASTGSIPASVTCFWYSGDKTVTIYYGQTDVVQGKNKSGF